MDFILEKLRRQNNMMYHDIRRQVKARKEKINRRIDIVCASFLVIFGVFLLIKFSIFLQGVLWSR